jgi:hypothetical protein
LSVTPLGALDACKLSFHRQVAAKNPREKGSIRFSLYRRHMKVISYLGSVDSLFGVTVTTRNWNTITAIAKVLGAGRT